MYLCNLFVFVTLFACFFVFRCVVCNLFVCFVGVFVFWLVVGYLCCLDCGLLCCWWGYLFVVAFVLIWLSFVGLVS